MIILKQVIHDVKTNSVEATWVDRTIMSDVEVPEEVKPDTEGPDGEVIPGEIIPAHTVKGKVIDVPVRCHSYADVQMSMLCSDLGDDAAEYDALIALVESNIKPIPPEPLPVLVATKYKFRMALLNVGLLDDIESFIAVTEDKAIKVAWQYADEYRTDDPLVLGMGYALGKSDAEIRAVFELANSL